MIWPMRAYHQTEQPDRLPQALQLAIGGGLYRWVLLHASLGNRKTVQRRPRRPRGHQHGDAYHVLLYTEGDTDVLLEGRLQPVRPGTLVLSSPGDRHDFAPARPGTICYSQITFGFFDGNGSPLDAPLHEILGAWSGLELEPQGTVVSLDERGAGDLLAALTRVLDALEGGGAGGQLGARAATAEVFALLVRDVYLRRGERPASTATAGLAAARAHIRAHYRERISVAELARMAYLSIGYFLRAFRREYGVSPIAWQGRLRAEAARTLLRFSNLSCKEIASRLGYADGYHFSKSFKKITGAAPSAYRAADP
jgi:AraC-like DNA-binding protein